jgi:uncharacterized protein with HEPN domain
MKDDLHYVGHIVDSARRIEVNMQDVSREAFDANEVLRLAIAHLIQTMGEAARLLSPAFRQQHGRVPWQQIVGMRNRLVHDYLNVDFDIVWQVATVDVPVLLAQLVPMISEAASGDE